MAQVQNVGKNIKMEVSEDGKELVVRIRLDERHGLSSTAKTIQVASTGGNKKVKGTEVSIGINAYVKVTPEELAKLNPSDQERYHAAQEAAAEAEVA